MSERMSAKEFIRGNYNSMVDFRYDKEKEDEYDNEEEESEDIQDLAKRE